MELGGTPTKKNYKCLKKTAECTTDFLTGVLQSLPQSQGSRNLNLDVWIFVLAPHVGKDVLIKL